MTDIVVIKRDGTEELYSEHKVSSSIMRAAISVGGDNYELADELANEVTSIIEGSNMDEIKAETLEKIIQDLLIDGGYSSTATAYIIYAADRTKQRDMNSELMRSYEAITFNSGEVMDAKKENANINSETAMGTMLKYGSEGAKKFNLKRMISPKIAEGHINGDYHIHDLDFYTLAWTCNQIPLDTLFKGGFNTGHGFLREPGNIRTAGALAAIAIQSNQNDMYGGQSIPMFDYYLAPYVALSYVKQLAHVIKIKLSLNKESYNKLRKRLISYQKEHTRIMNDQGYTDLKQIVNDSIKEDIGLTLSKDDMDNIFENAYEDVYDETYQSMEAFIHNMNTLHSRAGSQVPFSSVNYGTDTSTEGRIIMETLLLSTDRGLGYGETPIFPIQIFKIKEGVNLNPEDPNYDLFKLSCKVSAKRLYPNFVNLDATYNKEIYVEGHPETEMATMGCVEGKETIDAYLVKDGEKLNSKIYTMEYIFHVIGDLLGHEQQCTSGNSEYYDLRKSNIELYVKDSLLSENNIDKYVKVNTVIRNSNVQNWRKITLTNGVVLVATGDHPLYVVGKGRVYVDNISLKDKLLYKTPDGLIEIGIQEISKECSFLHRSLKYSYDLETESDRFNISNIVSHNCRTRIGKNSYDPDKSVIPGRGNLSFTSINLPRLAILSKGNINEFFQRLDNMMEIVHEQLLERFEVQCRRHMINHPFLLGQGCWVGSDRLGPNDDIRSILKHGTLAVGFIGLAETLVSLIGKHHGESDEAQQLGLKIISHMRQFTDKWSEEEHMNYSVIGTPAEGLSGRFVKIDKQKFGNIPGVTDKDYYTNSSHVPVKYPITAFKKIEIEAPYHEIENGGHISYIELDGDPTKNLKAFMKIIRYMHDKNMGYMSINHPVDYDSVCQYVGIINDVCPRCGRREGEPMTLESWMRLKGYSNAGNAKTLGYPGDINEENDRIPNSLG